MEIRANGNPEIVISASGVLRRGGLILYPTDTVYGIGADALSSEAVARVYDLKGRDRSKPIHAIVSNALMIEEFAEFNDLAKKLAQKFWPGPLTLVLNKKPGIDTGIAQGIDSFAVRIPRDQFCLDLVRSFGGPITTTSANITGSPTEGTIASIVEQFGHKADLIDLAVDAGELLDRVPSTIVNVRAGGPSIIRVGAISSAEILDAAKA